MPHAIVVTDYGPPSVLQWQPVPLPEPGAGEIRVAVRAAGVGPTDLAIRAGHLQGAFPLEPGAGVLGFEAAGVVDAIGDGVDGVALGDEVVAVLQAHLGGYAEFALTPVWSPKPTELSWVDAAAIPASAEAAVRVLRELAVTGGETLLVLGGAGAVGAITIQLAVARGAQVIAAVAEKDFDATRAFGATPVDYRGDLVAQVHATGLTVDAVADAAGKGGLPEAIRLVGGPRRVITLSDPTGPPLGVRLSSPVPDLERGILDGLLPQFADGTLTMRPRRALPIAEAAQAHDLVAAGTADKLVLVVAD